MPKNSELKSFYFLQHTPVPFVSFSSSSPLLLSLYKESNVVVFYGPHINFMHPKSSLREKNYTIASFLNMIAKKAQGRGVGSNLRKYIYRYKENSLFLKNIYFYMPKIAEEEKIFFIGYPEEKEIEGRLLASTLQGLTMLIDYGFDIDYKDRIVIVDSMNISFYEALEEFKRLAKGSNMKEAGCIFVSSLTNRKQVSSSTFSELGDYNKQKDFIYNLRSVFKGTPVLYGFPAGHTRYKLTIPLGVKSYVNLRTGDITLLEDPLKDN